MNFLSKINKALDKVNPIKTVSDLAEKIGDETLDQAKRLTNTGENKNLRQSNATFNQQKQSADPESDEDLFSTDNMASRT
jgi:hypothetical protein